MDSIIDAFDCMYPKRKIHICCTICKKETSLTSIFRGVYVCSEDCRHEYVNRTTVQKICSRCGTIISLENVVYMAKDMSFCTEVCRSLFLRKNR